MEHYGAGTIITKWQPSEAQFDHARTGWPLTGVHAKQQCRKCHTAEHVSAQERVYIRVKDFNRTFLGINRNCATCHQDAHQGKLGSDCQSCHSTGGNWKVVQKFDHSKTGYALTGEHVHVACEKCHTPAGPERKTTWKGLKFDGCDSCHKSPHPGAFSKAACATCHNTNGFKAGSIVAAKNHFDHSTAKFALAGKHLQVDCEKCHAGGNFMKHIAFQRCADCHMPSPHGNEFANRIDAGECSACHTVDGFKPAKFTVEQHASTRFPLLGKHAPLECSKCHKPAGKETVYHVKFAECTDCHKDRHDGQLKAAPYLNRCQICHSVDSFKPSIFTVELHRNTRYTLEGPHAKLQCAACHRKPAPTKGAEDLIVFRFADRSCTACHADPHRSEFNERMAQLDKEGKPFGCEACHTLDTWNNLARFDHSATQFPLLGKHTGMACTGCHKPVAGEPGLKNVNFRQVPSDCEPCHKDAHASQFADAKHETDCSTCHNVFRWGPSAFDHEASSYKLEGEHRIVACAKCHTTTRKVESKDVVFYKPTPSTCQACHRTGKIRPLTAD
jgi:hypothetical protein